MNTPRPHNSSSDASEVVEERLLLPRRESRFEGVHKLNGLCDVIFFFTVEKTSQAVAEKAFKAARVGLVTQDAEDFLGLKGHHVVHDFLVAMLISKPADNAR